MATKRTISQAPHWCPQCEELVHLVAVYECNNCSTESEERRCEDCHKFCSRREEDGCENCLAECEEVEVVTDHDGTAIRAVDYVAEGPSLAERDAAALAADKIERAAAEQKMTEKAYAGSTATSWSEVKVGDQILAFKRDGSLDTMMGNQTVLSLQTVGPNPADTDLSAGQIIAHLHRHGVALEVHFPDEIAYVVNDPKNTRHERPVTERYSFATVDHASGGSIKYINADMTINTMNSTRVPVGVIMGRSSTSSGNFTGIGTFADPAEADAFAATARLAASKLAEASTEAEEFPLALEGDEYVFANSPTRYVRFVMGEDDFREKQIIEVRTGSDQRAAMMFSVHYPSVLLNMAAAAEHIALKLREALDVN